MGVKERVLSLCEKNNVKVGTLEREIKLANGTIGRWTESTFPNSQTLSVIADYFGVSTDWLLGREQEVDIEDELERLKTDQDLRVLLSSSAKLSKEDLQFITKLAERMNEER